MSPERLKQIKAITARRAAKADKILEGEADNYDGADGARHVSDLCGLIEELVAAIESKTP